MKLCIPTETNEGKSATVYGHFGSAPYFTIVDTEKDTVEVIDNANQHHAHGMCQTQYYFFSNSSKNTCN